MWTRQRIGLCLIGAALLAFGAAVPASAQQSDTVTVTGQTVSTISLVLATESVSFGQITEPGLKFTTSPVTGSATATFTGSQPRVTRNVTTNTSGFSALQVRTDGVLSGVENSVVSNPAAIDDVFYLQVSGNEPSGTFSYTVTYTAGTL